MADKYLRRLGEFDLPKGIRVKNGEQKGDRERWERSWEVTGPQLTEQQIVQSLDKMLSRVWSKTGSNSEKTGQKTSWTFRGHDGTPWKALAIVRPTLGVADKFLMTLSVEQATQP
jgi:hypothetical protein